MKTVRTIEILRDIFISRNNCTCGGWWFVDFTELHHIQYLQQTPSCYTPLQPYPTKIQQRKKVSRQNELQCIKQNQFLQWLQSQYTNKLKTMVYITLDQITPTALALNATTHPRHLSNENIPLQQNNRNKAIATSTIVFALTKSKLNYHLLCTTWTSRKTIFPQWFSYAIHVRKSDKVIDLIHLNEACLAENLILR